METILLGPLEEQWKAENQAPRSGGSKFEQEDLSLNGPQSGAKAVMSGDQGLSGSLGCVTPEVPIK